jgi:hypothetical protein
MLPTRRIEERSGLNSGGSRHDGSPQKKGRLQPPRKTLSGSLPYLLMGSPLFFSPFSIFTLITWIAPLSAYTCALN